MVIALNSIRATSSLQQPLRLFFLCVEPVTLRYEFRPSFCSILKYTESNLALKLLGNSKSTFTLYFPAMYPESGMEECPIVLADDGNNLVAFKASITTILQQEEDVWLATTGKLIPPKIQRGSRPTEDQLMQLRRFNEADEKAKIILFKAIDPELAIQLFYNETTILSCAEVWSKIQAHFQSRAEVVTELELFWKRVEDCRNMLEKLFARNVSEDQCNEGSLEEDLRVYDPDSLKQINSEERIGCSSQRSSDEGTARGFAKGCYNCGHKNHTQTQCRTFRRPFGTEQWKTNFKGATSYQGAPAARERDSGARFNASARHASGNFTESLRYATHDLQRQSGSGWGYHQWSIRSFEENRPRGLEIQCYNCGRRGHMTEQCRIPTGPPGSHHLVMNSARGVSHGGASVGRETRMRATFDAFALNGPGSGRPLRVDGNGYRCVDGGLCFEGVSVPRYGTRRRVYPTDSLAEYLRENQRQG